VVDRFPKRELPSKADPPSRAQRFTRRSLFRALVGGAIGTMPKSGAGADPTLAAIEAHTKAYAELDRALDRQEQLERSLLRRFGGFDEAAFDGNPSWIFLQAELDSLHEAETRAALSLIRVEPSTLAGEVARKRYVDALARAGYQWSAIAGSRNILSASRPGTVRPYMGSRTAKTYFPWAGSLVRFDIAWPELLMVLEPNGTMEHGRHNTRCASPPCSRSCRN
jgi:hypothetical protein